MSLSREFYLSLYYLCSNLKLIWGGSFKIGAQLKRQPLKKNMPTNFERNIFFVLQRLLYFQYRFQRTLENIISEISQRKNLIKNHRQGF